MAVKLIKPLELHYTVIQFLINQCITKTRDEDETAYADRVMTLLDLLNNKLNNIISTDRYGKPRYS